MYPKGKMTKFSFAQNCQMPGQQFYSNLGILVPKIQLRHKLREHSFPQVVIELF